MGQTVRVGQHEGATPITHKRPIVLIREAGMGWAEWTGDGQIRVKTEISVQTKGSVQPKK